MFETDQIVRGRHTARQLCRLFKVERLGSLDRGGGEVRQRLIERRAALLSELLRLADNGRGAAPPRSLALERALAALAQEVTVLLPVAQSRVERLGRDLRLRLGEGQATGVRDNPNVRFLGKS